MDDLRKHYFILSLVLFINSGLLLIKFLPNVILWNVADESFLSDLLGLLWPLMGISAAAEFLIGDKWGWGGMLFHFFILYCMLYCLILTISALFNFSLQIDFILIFILNLSITIIGWFGFLYYYD